MSINRFSSREACKKELLSILNDHPQNETLVLRAADFKKREIQWIRLGIPSLLFGVIMLYMVHAVIGSPVTKYVFGGLAYILALAIAFRITFYQDWLDTCKLLMLAADELLFPEEATLLPGEPSTLPAMPILQEAGLQTELMAPLDAEPLDATPKVVYGKELLPLFEQAGNGAKYGRITIFLLDQLIRRECKQPSVYDGSVTNVSVSTEILGCKAKNIGSKFQDYYSRETIRFEKRNSKTTHTKYLKILQDHYQKSGDLALYEQALDLESFLSSIRIERKIRKMHLRP